MLRLVSNGVSATLQLSPSGDIVGWLPASPPGLPNGTEKPTGASDGWSAASESRKWDSLREEAASPRGVAVVPAEAGGRFVIANEIGAYSVGLKEANGRQVVALSRIAVLLSAMPLGACVSPQPRVDAAIAGWVEDHMPLLGGIPGLHRELLGRRTEADRGGDTASHAQILVDYRRRYAVLRLWPNGVDVARCPARLVRTVPISPVMRLGTRPAKALSNASGPPSDSAGSRAIEHG